ncbi:hypothetical protein GCM10012320_30680 [Sinomonas cellulolyticus]|nr:hypothetical protein GCM10012320_30680 [Sinomonas sp. KCTC 49339]
MLTSCAPQDRSGAEAKAEGSPLVCRGRAWQFKASAHGERGPDTGHTGTESTMGLGDKISNKAEELGGKIKESTGRATDNPNLEAEGQADQASAGVKQAGEHVKDAVKDVKDGFSK